jgi:citrate lyase beta subunit
MTGSPLQGACLYMPALHPSLPTVLTGASVPGLRALVVCMEDALSSSDIAAGLQRVRTELAREGRAASLRVYVRPRNQEMMLDMLAWAACAAWDGFVLPKLSVANAAAWMEPFRSSTHRVMPILETADVFDPFALRHLCDVLADPSWRDAVDVVRIGGTDLFAVLGTRRPRGHTVYESILGPTLQLVASQLLARGMSVTAPVCEALGGDDVFRREVAMDVEAGFVGKTAVHPHQVRLINESFAVPVEELHEAERILSSEQAVFQSRGAMCESLPHRRWAERIVARAAVFGMSTKEESPERSRCMERC